MDAFKLFIMLVMSVLLVMPVSALDPVTEKLLTGLENSEGSILTTTSFHVFHMETDNYKPGYVMYTDQYALKTSDGNITETIAGHSSVRGYKEGVGEDARFDYIVGFTQISPTQVVVLDYYSRCLREVDRVTRVTSVFAGQCRSRGYKDFNFKISRGVIVDEKNSKQLLLNSPIYPGTGGVITIEIESKISSTFTKSDQLNDMSDLVQDKITGDIYITNSNSLYKLSYNTRALNMISYGNTGQGDGKLPGGLYGVFMIETVILVADKNNDRILKFDTVHENWSTLNACDVTKTHKNTSECVTESPVSILLTSTRLLIGGNKSITYKPVCNSHNMTVYTDPQTGTARVELAKGYSIDLSEGIYTYETPSPCIITLNVINNLTGFDGEKCQHNIDECLSSPCVKGACVDGVNDYSCNCEAGYSGKNCDYEINECYGGPCQNNGTCKDLVGKYECVCGKGYNGINCETTIDYCATKPCKEGATCISELGNYVCQCQPGYTGKNCLTDIDECEAKPCLNGGTCNDKVNAYTCTCPSTYSGNNCQTDVNECKVEATCLNNDGGFTCLCKSGFTGGYCETNINDCVNQPCKNDGTCYDLVDDFYCSCQQGFTGRTCDNNANDCLPNPCRQGICDDGINSFNCTCYSGWDGTYCNENIDDCVSNKCKNGATCLDKVNKYECICPPGYDGTYCDKIINACDSSPCVTNNTQVCKDTGPGIFFCECLDGFSGQTCHQDIDECSNQPCANRGTCTDLVNAFRCDCVQGWDGTTCEVDANDCVDQPDGKPLCLNNGICQDAFDSYTCSCQQGFNGTRCENKIDYCASSPCQHRSSCTSLTSGFKCDCAIGYTGMTCSADINECAQSPCLNNAKCNDLIGSFTCDCMPGFTDKKCETNIDECISSPCQNEGICVDKINRYKCRCQVGFNSTNCENQIDWCAANKCSVNSNCTNLPSAYTCNCFAGYEGTYCNTETDECEDNPCKNGANCTDLVNDYSCSCQPGWESKQCDVNIDECASDPCQNGGTCYDKVNSYKCGCDVGYSGEFCQTNTDNCGPINPCLHGGNCTDLVADYNCTCQPGFRGKACSENIDDCLIKPCQNSGICVDGANSYSCVCSEFFDGVDCEIPAELNGACIYNNLKKEKDDTWPLGCNLCDCIDGNITCTRLWCGWEYCTDNNMTLITNEVCDSCGVPACLNENCTEHSLCYDRPYSFDECLEDECLNETLTINFEKLPVGMHDEELCKDLRRKVLFEKQKIGESPVRIECRWAGEGSNDINIHIRTKGEPGLATVVWDILLGKEAFVIAKPVPKAPAPCPKIIRGVTSPLTGLATLDLTMGDFKHRLSLPVGEYQYNTSQYGNVNCTIPVRISDFHLTRRMVIRANYNVRCDKISDPITKATLNAIIQSFVHKIDGVCGHGKHH